MPGRGAWAADRSTRGLYRDNLRAGGGIPNMDGACFDRENGGEGDGDIDVDDVSAFEACATGPDVPFDAGNPGDCIP